MNPFLLVVATAGIVAIYCVQNYVAAKWVRAVLLLLLGVAAIIILIDYNLQLKEAAGHARPTPLPYAVQYMFPDATPAPRVIAKGTPEPAKVREEILRKYGKP